MNALAEPKAASVDDSSSPFVSAAYIDAMCFPLTQAAAKIKFLKGLGLNVGVQRNGKPFLMKCELERVYGAGWINAQPAPDGPDATTPNVTALSDYFKRKKANGASS